jgi:hypothetical protein
MQTLPFRRLPFRGQQPESDRIAAAYARGNEAAAAAVRRHARRRKRSIVGGAVAETVDPTRVADADRCVAD